MKRRFLALALLPALLDPLALLAGVRMSPGQECSDHVCMCARLCPPRRNAARHCPEGASAAASMRAACNHDQASVLGSVTSAIPPAGPAIAVVLGSGFPLHPANEALPTGFVRIDPPPPKSL